MADIIRAGCPSCGLTIRVAAEHGGKKAKCPKCAGVITIPNAADSGAGIVPDSELPRVGEEAPAGEHEHAHAHAKGETHAPAAKGGAHHHPPPEGAPEGAHAGHEHAAGEHADHAHGPGHPHYERGKAHFMKKGTARRTVPMHPRSTRKTILFASMYAFVAIGIGGLVWWMMTREGGGLPGQRAERDEPAPPPPPPPSQAELDLRERFFHYMSACSNSEPKKIAEFYIQERRPDVVQFFDTLLGQRWLTYNNCVIASVAMTDKTASMEVTFDRILTDRNATPGRDPKKIEKDQKRTIGWALVDGLWLIADAPAE